MSAYAENARSGERQSNVSTTFKTRPGPGGTYRLTPLYDVLTAQPSLVSRQIETKQMRLAMSVGNSNHYKIDKIVGRHFRQTGEAAGLPKTLVEETIADIAAAADRAITSVEDDLPPDFPASIHDAVNKAVTERLRSLRS